MKVLLTIAGHDPSSGAGITADLAVFAAHGFFGVSAITALTVQSTTGVRGSYPTAPAILRDALESLAADFTIAGIKIGMLANAANVQVVADFLQSACACPVVLDPVLRSSSGAELLDSAGLALLRQRLLPQVTVVTPNRQEFARLAGSPTPDLPPGLAILVTGGEEDATDVLHWRASEHRLEGDRIESTSTHGTGCAFSSALLCGLASGLDVLESAGAAKRYVAESIRRAPGLGRGHGPLQLPR